MSPEDEQQPREDDIRARLEQILEELKKPYTWHTGQVEFELDSGSVVVGTLQYLEAASAIIEGPRGLESVVLKNVRDLRVWMESPGPE